MDPDPFSGNDANQIFFLLSWQYIYLKIKPTHITWQMVYKNENELV